MQPAAGFLKHIRLRPVLCSMLTGGGTAGKADALPHQKCGMRRAVLLHALCLLCSTVCAIGFKVTCSKSHSTARQKRCKQQQSPDSHMASEKI